MAVTKTPKAVITGSPASATYQVVPEELRILLDEMRVETAAAADAQNRLAAVACATTANITLSGSQTIDGVSSGTSRVLVKNQTTTSQNGIYVSAAGAWTRATDADTSAEIALAYVHVIGGTANGGKNYQVVNSPAIGVDAVTWAEVGSAADVLALAATLGDLATQDTATAAQISDATAAGRALLTGANAAAQRSSIGLSGAVKVETTWNPIGGVFPGSGAALKGDMFRVSGFAATVDGVPFSVGDVIFALVDNASTTTYAANWFHLPANQFFALQQAIVAQQALETTADGVAINVGDVSAIVAGPDGQTQLTLSPHSVQIGYGGDVLPPGLMQDGMVTGVTHSGDYWQFSVDGVRYLVHDGFPDFTPTLPDTPTIDIATRNGQSWNTQYRETADLDNEDATGRIRRNLEQYRTTDFCVVRSDTDFTPASPWENSTYHKRAYSTDTDSGASGTITGFRWWKAEGDADFYTIGEITSAQRQEFLREMRQPRPALVSLQCGRAGTSEEYFLKDGSSFAGTGGTVNAAIIVGQTYSFWHNDGVARADIDSVVQNDWLDKPVTYDVQTFDQGGAGTTQTADDDHYFNFLNAFRADVDSLALNTTGNGKQHILIPQGFAASKETAPGWQPIDQLRWAQANASGRDWLAGPAYQWQLLQESVAQSAIHGTSMHNLRKGEMMGLAEAYLTSPKIGSWQPFWKTDVDITGALITVTVNSPRAATGLPVLDTTTIEAAANYGFKLYNWTGGVLGSAITLGAVTFVDANTITIAISGSLSGVTDVEFSYAALRGVAQADATVGLGTHSAAWGNIKKAGKHIGKWTEEPIDLWLCSFGDIITL